MHKERARYMFIGLYILPMVMWAYTITTEYKVGDSVCTSLDTSRHNVFVEQLKKETQKNILSTEDTLEGKMLIKQFLDMNGLRFSAEEREQVYAMQLARMGQPAEQFEEYLRSQNLSKESYIDEIVYRQEVARWMVQMHGWRETVSQQELAAFKKKMMLEAQNTATQYTFEVVKLKSKKDLPSHIDDKFWAAHAKDSVIFTDQTLAQIPETYEAFFQKSSVGDSSQPIEAFDNFHIIRILAKKSPPLPTDDMLKHYLLEQKCIKHLPEWLEDQFKWVYKGK